VSLPATTTVATTVHHRFRFASTSGATELEEWQASAHEETFHRRSWSRTPTSESKTLLYGWGVGVSFWTLFRSDALDLDSLRASVHASTDGLLIHEVNDVQFQYRTSYDDWDDVTIRCAYAKYDDRYSGVSACRYTSPWEPTRVSFNYTFNGGSVTYISRGWYQTYVGGQPGDVYYYNTVWPNEFGTRFELGNTATIRVQFSDSSRYYEANPTFELFPVGWNNNYPDWCTPDGSYCGGSTDVTQEKTASRETGKTGQTPRAMAIIQQLSPRAELAVPFRRDKTRGCIVRSRYEQDRQG
jgi:hypothetical protein